MSEGRDTNIRLRHQRVAMAFGPNWVGEGVRTAVFYERDGVAYSASFNYQISHPQEAANALAAARRRPR